MQNCMISRGDSEIFEKPKKMRFPASKFFFWARYCSEGEASFEKVSEAMWFGYSNVSHTHRHHCRSSKHCWCLPSPARAPFSPTPRLNCQFCHLHDSLLRKKLFSSSPFDSSFLNIQKHVPYPFWTLADHCGNALAILTRKRKIRSQRMFCQFHQNFSGFFFSEVPKKRRFPAF